MGALNGLFAAPFERARREARTLVAFYLPFSTVTFRPVAANELAGASGVRREEIADAATIAGAFEAIVRAVPAPGDFVLNARAALVFRDAAGEPLLSVFQSRRPSAGEFAGRTCVFATLALWEWFAARNAT